MLHLSSPPSTTEREVAGSSAEGVLFVLHAERKHGSGRDIDNGRRARAPSEPSRPLRALLREALAAATSLRRASRAAIQVELMASRSALQMLATRETQTQKAWDTVRELVLAPRVQALLAKKHAAPFPPGDARNAYLHKLSALLLSRFERTLYLDLDVVVLSPTFAHDILRRALRVADVAMPLDPGRASHLVPHESRAQLAASRVNRTAPRDKDDEPWVVGAPWVAPTVGPPMLCSAVLAFRRSPQTADLFFGASRRLLERRHRGVRQGDQESIWFEWTGAGENTSRLRVLALPEETYCPLERWQRPAARWRAGGAVWRTSWRRGVYPCAAVHGHAYSEQPS